MRAIGLSVALFGVGCSCGGPGASSDGGDDGPAGCSDQDGDEYGVGADCLGSDCDDSNPEVWSAEQCAATCDTDPHSTGCPCDSAAFPEPEICFTGPDASLGVGECHAGLRLCEDDVWGACEGQTIPLDEICDGLDNDCDAEVDEGVTNQCGTCGDCEEILVGNEDGAGDWDLEGSSGVIVDENGDITLDGTTIQLHVIWVANSLDGTVSKIDTRTREEEARYRTGPLGVSNNLWGGTGDNPSRTSVNYLGDAYIANRSFSGEASATKIYATGCPDRNGDGGVDTSSGWDDVLDWDDDECIAWNTGAGGAGGLGRAIAVEARIGLDGLIEEFVWLGLYSRQQFHEIDGDDGELTGVVADVGTTPYGAAIDRESNLWCASLAGNICRFNTLDPDDNELIAEGAGGGFGGYNYGITVDSDGNVWTAGADVSKYTVADGTWESAPIASRGIAADAAGWVWTHNDDGRMYRIAQDDPADNTLMQGYGGRGVAIDFDGMVWFINWSRGAGDALDGDISVVDPDDIPAVAGDLDLCCDTINNSYTYSDMTGFQLRNATNPLGNYDAVFEPCPDGETTTWTGISWEGVTPAGTFLRFQVKTGDSLDDVNAQPWVDAAVQPGDDSPFDIEALLGDDAEKPFLMIRVLLVSESREAAPTLHLLGAQRACGFIIG